MIGISGLFDTLLNLLPSSSAFAPRLVGLSAAVVCSE